MGVCFVDYECPKCKGRGHIRGKACPECCGTGSVGASFMFPNAPEPQPTEFAKAFRAWRESKKMTFRDVTRLIGMPPARVSEIERGRRQETLEEQFIMHRLMEESCTK